MDDEIKGEGNSVNYKFRMHDPRIGRFFAVDPLAGQYPHNSPYAFSENVVINAVELEGLEKVTLSGETYLIHPLAENRTYDLSVPENAKLRKASYLLIGGELNKEYTYKMKTSFTKIETSSWEAMGEEGETIRSTEYERKLFTEVEVFDEKGEKVDSYTKVWLEEPAWEVKCVANCPTSDETDDSDIRGEDDLPYNDIGKNVLILDTHWYVHDTRQIGTTTTHDVNGTIVTLSEYSTARGPG